MAMGITRILAVYRTSPVMLVGEAEDDRRHWLTATPVPFTCPRVVDDT